MGDTMKDMANKNPLQASPPPCISKSGEIVDWPVATDKERADHFKTLDEQFSEVFGDKS